VGKCRRLTPSRDGGIKAKDVPEVKKYFRLEEGRIPGASKMQPPLSRLKLHTVPRQFSRF
jgi:hypothetical protein